MKPESILQILLVRAVEEADLRGESIPWPDRERATLHAAAVTGEPEVIPESASVNSTLWQILSVRAGLLHDQALAVVGHVPVVWDMKWIGIGLCATAFVIGWATHSVGLSHSFDLLAGPFLLVLLWNTFVYILLIAEYFHTPSQPSESGLVSILVDRMHGTLAGRCPSNKAAEAYSRSVSSWMRSWFAPGAISWFHAGSACFTIGLVAAIYFRGIPIEYFAGWESTWIDAHGVSVLLGTLLKPASWITGIALPDSKESWELMRRTASFSRTPAGPWIHLYAVTLSGWIILPRLILSLFSCIRSARNRSSPPPWTTSDPYLRRILALAKQGNNIGVAVLPFDFKRSSTIASGSYHDAVDRLVREVWGQNAHTCWMQRAAYGDEDSIWDDIWSSARDCGGAMLVFDAHAIPENEVHGTLFESVWSHFSNESGGLLVALECTNFDISRIDSRVNAWTQLTKPRGIPILPLQDGSALNPTLDPPDFLRRME